MLDCKFIWYNLPKQVSELFEEVIYWYNLPNKLNSLIEDQKIDKPNCYLEIYPYGHKRFIWWNLTSQMNKLCQLVEFSNAS